MIEKKLWLILFVKTIPTCTWKFLSYTAVDIWYASIFFYFKNSFSTVFSNSGDINMPNTFLVDFALGEVFSCMNASGFRRKNERIISVK